MRTVRAPEERDILAAMEGTYWQPLLVLVSGAPGSGKTTLAAELARRLDLPHLNRDQLANGLRLTVARGAPREIVARSVAAQFGTLESLLAIGVSLVSDGTMYAGEMEASVRRLRDFGEVVNVHCRSQHASTRFFARQRERGASNGDIRRWEETLDAYGDRIVEPLELHCRRIDVCTDDGYEPTIERIVSLLAPSGAERDAVRFLAQ